MKLTWLEISIATPVSSSPHRVTGELEHTARCSMEFWNSWNSPGMLDLPQGKGEEEDLCEPHQYSSSMRTSWGDESRVLGWDRVMAQGHLLILVISKGESRPCILGTSSVLGSGVPAGNRQLQHVIPAAAPPQHRSEQPVCPVLCRPLQPRIIWI